MNSAYVDLGIGLALAFFLLSLLASAVNEAIVRLLGVRAKFLWASLRDLLDQKPADNESRTPNGIFDIVSFATSPGRDQRPDFNSVTPELGTATETLPHLTTKVHERISGIDFFSRKVTGGKRNGVTRKTTISQVPPKRLALAVMEVLDGAYDGNVTAFRAALDRAGSPFTGPLDAILREARDDREKLRAGLESWFDSEMTRLTAVYRRHTRWMIGFIAFLITLFVGFDAADYAGSLLDDQAGRQQLVAAATSGDQGQLRQLCGAHDDEAEVDTVACFSSVIGQPALADAFATSLVGIQPTGEDPRAFGNAEAWWSQLSNPAHWPGFVMTVVAMLFGAPFWWEVLRRLMGMRTRRPTTADGV